MFRVMVIDQNHKTRVGFLTNIRETGSKEVMEEPNVMLANNKLGHHQVLDSVPISWNKCRVRSAHLTRDEVVLTTIRCPTV